MKYVVIDMNRYFKETAEICFPNAKIVIDRYHVVRQAIWALENVRKAEQKALSAAWRKFCKHSRRLLCKNKEKLKDEEAMSSFMLFSICATYCTLSIGLVLLLCQVEIIPTVLNISIATGSTSVY